MSARKFYILFLTIFLLWGCRKSFEIPKWDVDALVPLARAKFSAKDIVRYASDSLFQASSDNSLKIVFDGLLFRLRIDTLVDFPDTSITSQFVFPFPLSNIPPGTVIFRDSSKTRYNLGDVQLTEGVIRSGWVEVSIFTSVNATTILTYEIRYSEHDGNPLTITELIPPDVTIKKLLYLGDSIDNRGYRIDLRGPTGNEFNTISTRFTVTTDPNGGTVNLLAADKVIVSTTFIDIIPEYVKGYFGNELFKEDSIVVTDIFRNITGGAVDMEKLDIAIEIKNGIGVDLQYDLNEFSSVNSNTGVITLLNHPILFTPLNLTRALETGSAYPPVSSSYYYISLTESNSTIDALLENIPDRLGYKFTLSINPFGNNSLGNDFFYYDSPLEIRMKAEAPISFTANSFTLADTVKFFFGTGDSILEKKIKRGTLFLYADNGFPFDAKPLLLLLDSSQLILDSLIIPQGIIRSGTIGSDGKVSGKTRSVLTIPVDQPKLAKLHKTKWLLIRIGFTTPAGSSFIKIYADYSVDVTITGEFVYGIKQ